MLSAGAALYAGVGGGAYLFGAALRHFKAGHTHLYAFVESLALPLVLVAIVYLSAWAARRSRIEEATEPA